VRKLLAVLALATAVAIASPFASGAPDGLQRVAADQAFVQTGRVAEVQESSPVPGYAVPGVGDRRVATGLAGFAGTLLVFALGYGLAAVATRRVGGAAA
jgi:hypothetical protein